MKLLRILMIAGIIFQSYGNAETKADTFDWKESFSDGFRKAAVSFPLALAWVKNDGIYDNYDRAQAITGYFVTPFVSGGVYVAFDKWGQRKLTNLSERLHPRLKAVLSSLSPYLPYVKTFILTAISAIPGAFLNSFEQKCAMCDVVRWYEVHTTQKKHPFKLKFSPRYDLKKRLSKMVFTVGAFSTLMQILAPKKVESKKTHHQ